MQPYPSGNCNAFLYRSWLFALAMLLLLSSFSGANWFFEFGLLPAALVNFIIAFLFLALNKHRQISIGLAALTVLAGLVVSTLSLLLTHRLHLYVPELLLYASCFFIFLIVQSGSLPKAFFQHNAIFTRRLSAALLMLFFIKLLAFKSQTGHLNAGFTNYGTFSMITALLCWPLYTAMQHTPERWWYLPLIAGSWSVCIYNSTTIALLLHLLAIAPLAAGYVRKYRVWMAGAGIVTLTAFVLIFLTRENNSLGGRVNIWRIVMQHSTAIPWQGYGFNAFQTNYGSLQAQALKEKSTTDYNYDDPAYAFNEFIQVYFELGVPGLLLLLLFMGLLFLMIRKIPGGNTKWELTVGLLATLLVLSLSYPLHKPELLLLFFLLLCFPFTRLPVNHYIHIRSMRLVKTVSAIGITVIIIFYAVLIRDTSIWIINSDGKVFLKQHEQLILLDRHVRFRNFTRSKLLGQQMTASTERILHSIEELEAYGVDSDLLMMKGNYHFNIQQYQLAIACYRFASELVPYRIRPRYYLARTYREIKDDFSVDSLKKIILHQKPKVLNAAHQQLITLTKEL